jgi:hypothetical protein
MIVTLVYPGERHLFDDGLSVVTPVGAALIGLAEGQSLSYPMPDGAARTITVEKILYQPEAARSAHRAPPGMASAGDVFDEAGHLTALHHTRICDRLNAAGHWGASKQASLLARQLGQPEPSALWAVLMWNARPSPQLAEALTRWIAGGMPLPRGAAAGRTEPRA